MQSVFEYITSIFLTFATIFNLLPGVITHKTSYAPESDDIILNCVVVSDTHCDNNSFRDRNNRLRCSLAGMNTYTNAADILLNIGDITNSGSVREYFNFKRFTNTYASFEHIIPCMGNHDSWNGSADPDYNEAKRLYFKYLKDCGIETDKIYFSTVINGYTFISLASESLDLHEQLPTYSTEQFEFLVSSLKKAENSDKPIFVLLHRPISGHNGYDGNYYIPNEINEILLRHKDYDRPIFIFSGHCHTFSKNWIDNDDNLYYVALPSLCYNDETENECNDNGGMGFTMEVYEDRIIFKARNFIKNEFINDYRYEISFGKDLADH